MNQTMEDTGKEVAKIMWLVFPPIYIVIGTIGNCLAILVLTRKRVHATTSTIYLVALAVCDLIVLYASLFSTWIFKLLKTTFKTSFGCKVVHWLDFSSRDCSVWILVAITVDRIIACSAPFKYKFICSRMRAQIVVAATVFVIYGINAHLLYGLDMVTIEINNTTSMTHCLFVSPEYGAFFNGFFVFFDFLKFSLIPLLVILSGSIAIACLLYKKIIKVRRRVAPADEEQRSTPLMSSTNMTLLALNAAFLVCTIPLGIFSMSASFSGEGNVVTYFRRFEIRIISAL